MSLTRWVYTFEWPCGRSSISDRSLSPNYPHSRRPFLRGLGRALAPTQEMTNFFRRSCPRRTTRLLRTCHIAPGLPAKSRGGRANPRTVVRQKTRKLVKGDTANPRPASIRLGWYCFASEFWWPANLPAPGINSGASEPECAPSATISRRASKITPKLRPVSR